MKQPKKADKNSYPRTQTVVHMMIHAANLFPNRTAVICDETRLNYKQLCTLSSKISQKILQKKIRKGDRVAILVSTSPELPALIFGTLGSGAHAALINPRLTLRELRPLLKISLPRLVICDAQVSKNISTLCKELGFDILEVNSGLWALKDACFNKKLLPSLDDAAILLFTGGTTGQPKGVSHTHREVLMALRAIEDRWPSDPNGEVFLNIPPLFHIVGLYHGCFQPIYNASSSVLVSNFDASLTLHLIEKYKVSIFVAGIPTTYIAMLSNTDFDKTNLLSLKYACGGGAPLPEKVLKEWEGRSGVPALEGYGMTEGAPTCNNPLHGNRKALSVGKPVKGILLQIVDTETGQKEMPIGSPGEIRVQGSHIANGYFNNFEETSKSFKAGWLYTGDIAYRDSEDFIFIVDRLKDLVIVSGFNVFPREIEEVLMHHPNIKEVAAIGVPDHRKGEIVKVLVCLESSSNLTEEAIKFYCKDKLVGYKIPSIVEFRDELPKTAVGKIDKKKLK